MIAGAGQSGRWLDPGVDHDAHLDSPARPDEPTGPEPAREIPMWMFLVGIVAIATWLCGLVVGVASGSSNVIGGVIVAPPLLVITVLIARFIARADGQPDAFALIVAGFLLKCLGTLLRYWVAFSVYGSSDAAVYDIYGRLYATELRSWNMPDGPRWVGTSFIRLLTGFAYTIGPESKLSGFLIFGFLSFLGTLAFWRAFKHAISPTDDRRYLLLLLFVPSVVYWPSAIGKEAFMVLCAGFAALGAARILSHHSLTGYPLLALGLAGISFVRPHVGLVVFSGLAFASLIRSHRGRNPIAVLIGIALVVASGLLVVSRATQFFGIETFSREAIEAQLDEATERTSQGGSEFAPVRVNSPLDLPLATVTILYRPLPFEVRGPQEMASAMEGVALIALTIASRRRILTGLRSMRRLPYVAYCLAALLSFVTAFSSFSNFGILARQRTQILPLFLVLLAFPLPAARVAPERVADAFPGPAKPRSPAWNPAP